MRKIYKEESAASDVVEKEYAGDFYPSQLFFGGSR